VVGDISISVPAAWTPGLFLIALKTRDKADIIQERVHARSKEERTIGKITKDVLYA
jgi:hypothetical protein